jgi:hypothetical protein
MSIFENSFDWFEGYVELYFLCDTDVMAHEGIEMDGAGGESELYIFDADLSVFGVEVGLEHSDWVDWSHHGIDGMDAGHSFDATVHDAIPDYPGDVYRGPFGSTGGDGNNFYYFDRETGSSVMI